MPLEQAGRGRWDRWKVCRIPQMEYLENEELHLRKGYGKIEEDIGRVGSD
jgi:hypothetical protein